MPSQIISETYTGTTTHSGDPYKVPKNQYPKPPPIRKNSTSPGIWAISDKEKADLFASYLADVFSPHDLGTAPDIERNWTNLSIHQTHQPSRRTN